MNYKAPDNTVHVLDSAAYEYLLPAGSVPITEEEAEALRPVPVVTIPRVVTMRQSRLALLNAGLLTTVNEAIAAMPGTAGEAARIEWEYSQEVHRDRALVAALLPILGLTEAQLDDLFITAAAL